MPTLATIDPGTLFKADGVYAIKSEYFYSSGQCECILLSSGEYAHFSQGNDTPVEISHFHTVLEETQRAWASARAELSDLREHVERVFGGVAEPSIVVRELLRRARGKT